MKTAKLGRLILPGQAPKPERIQTEFFPLKDYEHPSGVLGSAKSCEQYTPEYLWKPGLEMFGIEEYDLDPATWDQSPIPCKQRFTRKDDGLSQEWNAQYLWSNFPYSDRDPATGKKQIVMGKWVAKLIHAHHWGYVHNALTLVKSDCRPEWFHALLGASSAYLFIKGGVTFEQPASAETKNSSSFFGSIIFYLGDEPDKFYDAYKHLGFIGSQLP
jgi:DNA N-6-adenine-methyltransferase (Dam)